MKFRTSLLSTWALVIGFSASAQAQEPRPHDDDDHSGAASIPRYSGAQAKAQDLAATLQHNLGLTDAQTYKIELIFIQENVDFHPAGRTAERILSKAEVASIRQRTRDQIRVLLTPTQRANFNLISQKNGGGLIGASPWKQLERLDKLVHLTAAQKQPILDELIDRTENLMENKAPEQAAKEQEIRLAMNAEIRALLTPEQQTILDDSLKARDGDMP